MLYTAGLIVLHLQLLFVVVVVLTNHNKPRWLTRDPAWHACGEYITPSLYFKNKPFEIKKKILCCWLLGKMESITNYQIQ